MKSYVYLHGFASGPSSSKAQYFRARLREHGIDLQIPQLDDGDFEHLTISRQLGVVKRVIGDAPSVLLGSSLGGYLAGLYAEQHPEVERLVLMAPAFEFRDRWAARVGPALLEEWRASGKLPVFHYGQNRQTFVGFELFADAAQYPAYPRVEQPTLVLQGMLDELVSSDVAREFCRRNPNADLHLFQSGHELTDVLRPMWALIEPFLLGPSKIAAHG